MRLRRLINDPRTIEIVEGSCKASPAVAAARVFYKRRKGFIEIWVREARIKSVFHDWIKIAKTAEVGDVRIKDDHATAKRTIVMGQVERVYCFRIPEEEADDEGTAQ